MLDLHGLTLDPVTGEVAELEPFNARMSKRGEQVTKNLARMQAEWKAAHPGQEPGPVVASRLMALAWCHERPNKKPSSLKDEAGWRTELERVGYAPNLPRVHRRPPASLDDLRVQEVAGRALNRCAGTASTWTRHTVQEHVTHVTTEAGVRAAPEALREFITLTTMLAAQDCLSVLPPGRVHPNHVAHLTSLHVVTVETELRDLLQARVSHQEPDLPDVSRLGREHDLDLGQTRAAVAVASTDPLVVVEGAAGAGKTTMLGAAIEAATGEGRSIRIVTPTEQSSGRKHQRTVTLSADYVAEHTHLSYASTAYGALSAAGVYVGMTRGRAMNQLHIVAADLDEARDQFTAALDRDDRDPADRGLTEASRAAEAAVRGLTDDGPAKLVNRERARLGAQIEHADRQVQTWEQAAAALDRQLQTQRAEQEEQQAVVAAAHAHAEQVSTDITAPLIAQATEDGTSYIRRAGSGVGSLDSLPRGGKAQETRHATHLGRGRRGAPCPGGRGAQALGQPVLVADRRAHVGASRRPGTGRCPPAGHRGPSRGRMRAHRAGATDEPTL